MVAGIGCFDVALTLLVNHQGMATTNAEAILTGLRKFEKITLRIYLNRIASMAIDNPILKIFDAICSDSEIAVRYLSFLDDYRDAIFIDTGIGCDLIDEWRFAIVIADRNRARCIVQCIVSITTIDGIVIFTRNVYNALHNEVMSTPILISSSPAPKEILSFSLLPWKIVPADEQVISWILLRVSVAV